MLKLKATARAAILAAFAFASLVVFGSNTASAGLAGTEHVSQGAINGNGAFDAGAFDATADLSRVFFVTDEPLAPTDTDASRDIYMREGGTTTHISQGAIGGNGAFVADFRGSSADGARVFFETAEALVASDGDPNIDVYMREGATTTLITTVVALNDAGFVGASADGSRVFFVTEADSATDNDGRLDVYMREGATTTHISQGAVNGNGAFHAAFLEASADGGRVFFLTDEQLATSDTDTAVDIYVRDGGTTTQISLGASGGNNPLWGVTFRRVSTDGGRVFFETFEQLEATDTDGSRDLYMREGATTTQISRGQVNGNGAFDASFQGASLDGSRVLFASSEQLAASDSDADLDVYMREGGSTTHISQGAINGNGAFGAASSGVAADGGRVFFRSSEQLAASDTDANIDLYMREGGTTTHISQGEINGSGAFDAVSFTRISADGGRVFFQTLEQLAPSDSDAEFDVYMREGGRTSHISRGQVNGNGAFGASSLLASTDGSRLLIGTAEQLAPSDLDSSFDIYIASIESIAPETTITGQPSNPTASTDAAFTYSSSEPGSSFECQIDGGGFASCPATGTSFSGLGFGSHIFAVRATDPADNTDPTPAEYSWTVDPGSSATTCRGKPATIVGTPRSDRVRGTRRKDVIAALGGKDNVKAGKGNDIVCLGKGNDSGFGAEGNDKLFGEDGNDKLFGEQGRDRLLGQDGRDLTNGGPGADFCNGGKSRDRSPSCEKGPEA